MKASFWKYSGCGNDFVLMEMPEPLVNLEALALRLCDRKEGIGADGLILIEPSRKADFKVHFYNADGSLAEMCGNGLRSAVHFYLNKQKNGKTATVETKERIHQAKIDGDYVSVSMGEALEIDFSKEIFVDGDPISLSYLNTGVPHAVHFTKNILDYDLETIGKKVRNHEAFAPRGTNFNIATIAKEGIEIRTYERGVEGETLACGTGAAASAVAASLAYGLKAPIQVKVKSGNILTIDFKLSDGQPKDLMLSGLTRPVFYGEIHLN